MKKLLLSTAAVIFFSASLIAQSNVGIGTASPASKLDVKGNLTVGNGYSGTAAPTNGAIIEGQVGIGTNAVNASSVLDVKATDKGIQIPNIALVTATNPISGTKPDGLLVYNTSTSGNYPTPGIYMWSTTNNDWNRVITNATLTSSLQPLTNTVSGGLTTFSYNGSAATSIAIATDGITNAMLQDNVITTNEIAANTITSADMGTASVDLASGVVFNILPVVRGGTERNSLDLNSVLVGNGTNPVKMVAVNSPGDILMANGSGVPTFTPMSGDVTISNSGVTSYNNVVPANKGGAGTVSGILKANGSGTVSAATASDLSTLANGTFINNSTSVQTGADFNVANSGTVGTTLTVGANATVGGDINVNGSDINGSGINGGSNATLNINSNTSTVVMLDRDNNNTSDRFAIRQNNAASDVFLVTEAGSVTANGSGTFGGAGSFDGNLSLIGSTARDLNLNDAANIKASTGLDIILDHDANSSSVALVVKTDGEAGTSLLSVTDGGNVIVPALNNSGTKVVTVDGTGTLSSTATISAGNLPDATTGAKGVVQLAGDLGGTGTTASAPVISDNAITSAKILNGTVANADLANMTALSVKGNATNTAAVPTDIAAGSDFQVLRRSGNAIGFGAVNLASANAVTGVLPVANGGTNSSATLSNNRVMISSGGAIVENAALTATAPVYTNASGTLTSAAPTSGTIGYWARSGSLLYPTTLSDSVGIGTSSPLGRLDVKGSGDKSTTYGFGVRNSADQYILAVRNDGKINVNTLAQNLPFEVNTGALGGSVGNVVETATFTGSNGNWNALDFRQLRTSAGSSWNSAGTRIQQRIDATWMGYMQFNGSGNDEGISFGTGSTTTAPGNVSERMRITSGGNVGIGATNPNTLLQLSRASAVNTLQDMLYLDNSRTYGSGAGKFGSALAFTTSENFTQLPSNRVLGRVGARVEAEINSGDGNLVFETRQAGTVAEKMRIQYNGNVGIATVAPATPLHVFTNSDVWAITVGDATGTSRNLKIAGTAGGVTGYGLLQTFSGSSAAGNLVLQRDAGSVGIGVISPNYTLHVARAAGSSSSSEFGISAGTQSMHFNSNLGSGSYNPLVVAGDHGVIFSNGSQNTGNLVLAPWSNASNGLKIMADGKVGVGVSSPAEKLHVNGNIVSNTWPAFNVYNNSGGDQSTNGTYNATVETFDNGNNFDLTTDEFTAPIKGIYQFNWTCYSNTPAGRVFMYVNGGAVMQTNGNESKAICITLSLNANDKVKLSGTASYPMTWYGAFAHNAFSGHLVMGLP